MGEARLAHFLIRCGARPTPHDALTRGWIRGSLSVVARIHGSADTLDYLIDGLSKNITPTTSVLSLRT